jgi:hypothetical protein
MCSFTARRSRCLVGLLAQAYVYPFHSGTALTATVRLKQRLGIVPVGNTPGRTRRGYAEFDIACSVASFTFG